MSEASIVAIVLGILTFLGGFLTYRAQQRKDALGAAFRLIDELQERVKVMQDDADAERLKRIALQEELTATRLSLKEQTQSRLDRERVIEDLRERLERVEKKTGPLDPKKAEK